MRESRLRWTQEEIEYLKDYYDGTNADTLGKYLNRNTQSVLVKAHRLGLTKKDIWSDEDVRYLKDNYEIAPMNVIAARLGRSKAAITSKANKIGLNREVKNLYEIQGIDTYITILSPRNSENGTIFIIDTSDIELVQKYKWTVSMGYINTTDGKILLSRLLLNAIDDVLVDHKDGNPLNNRRNNLRKCTRQQNAMNIYGKKYIDGGYKGVHWDKTKKLYTASIKHGYKQYFLGRYKTEEEAARAYDASARYLFGEFSRTNFEGDECISPEEVALNNLKSRKAKCASQYFGVTYNSQDDRQKRWVARCHGKTIGYFYTEVEAAMAYNQYVIDNNIDKHLNIIKEEQWN